LKSKGAANAVEINRYTAGFLVVKARIETIISTKVRIETAHKNCLQLAGSINETGLWTGNLQMKIASSVL
jgi:hypothetical protein